MNVKQYGQTCTKCTKCFISTDISVANLSRENRFKVRPRPESSTIAVCVHGGELTLSRLWGSVIVELEFDKTEVQFYEAERLVQFENSFILLDIFQVIYK